MADFSLLLFHFWRRIEFYLGSSMALVKLEEHLQC